MSTIQELDAKENFIACRATLHKLATDLIKFTEVHNRLSESYTTFKTHQFTAHILAIDIFLALDAMDDWHNRNSVYTFSGALYSKFMNCTKSFSADDAIKFMRAYNQVQAIKEAL